jgi:DNA-binding MarR family transcriptional regulator
MEAHFSTSQTRTILDPELARVLTTPRTLQMLSPFVVSTCSASDAANLLGLEISAMTYWIKRFLKLDLIKVVDLEARKGRSIKHYHASSEAFFVPFQVIPSPSLEAVQERLLEQIRAVMTRSQMAVILEEHPNAGVHVFSKQKVLRMNYVEGSNFEPLYSLGISRPAVLESWEVLKLDFETAKQLQIELTDLLERYKQNSGSHRYLVNLRLAPYKSKI